VHGPDKCWRRAAEQLFALLRLELIDLLAHLTEQFAALLSRLVIGKIDQLLLRIPDRLEVRIDRGPKEIPRQADNRENEQSHGKPDSFAIHCQAPARFVLPERTAFALKRTTVGRAIQSRAFSNPSPTG
jgi:hypothetical protein